MIVKYQVLYRSVMLCGGAEKFLTPKILLGQTKNFSVFIRVCIFIFNDWLHAFQACLSYCRYLLGDICNSERVLPTLLSAPYMQFLKKSA